MIPSGLDPARLYGAAQYRRSTRRYSAHGLEEGFLDRLDELCRDGAVFEDVRLRLVRVVPDGFFKGVIGSYFRIEGAPSAIILYARDRAVSAMRHLGYLGEAFVLEATASGVSTCWAAGSFSRDVAANVEEAPAGYSMVAVIALGRGSEPPKERRRKSVEHIAPGIGSMPTWAVAAVECARIAPSSINRQPWRFEYTSSGALAVCVDRGLVSRASSARLDCGIASLHLEVGAASSGVYGVWDETDPDRVLFEPTGAVEVEFGRLDPVRRRAGIGAPALGA